MIRRERRALGWVVLVAGAAAGFAFVAVRAAVPSGIAAAAAGATALVAAAARDRAAAATPPVAEPAGYWTGSVNAPTPLTLHGANVVSAKQVSALVKAGNAVIIDVSNAPRRPEGLAPGAPWMPTAHPGIPGALWIPGAGMGVVPVSVEKYFRAKLATSTGGDFSRPVVIYCHSSCWLSWNAAKRAVSYGYRNVSWFPQGIEGWRASRRSTTDLKPLQPPAASPSKAPPVPKAPSPDPDDDDSDSRLVLPA